MSTEANKAIARRYWEEIWNTGNVAILEEICATDCVFHAMNGGVRHGIESVKNGPPRWRTAFPDLHCVIEDVFAEGDKVVVRWTARGTHRGELELVQQIIPPTGKPVTWFGVDIYHILHGKIVEGWRSFDTSGLLQQFGVLPASG